MIAPPVPTSPHPRPLPEGEGGRRAPAARGGRITSRGEVRRFLTTAVPFCAGLVVVLLAVDAALGWRNERLRGRRAIGREVFEAKKAARAPGAGVRTLILGDSVARQMFRPGAEPGPHVRYLGTNFGISLAGQYYLLEEALRNCPGVEDVYLVHVVGVWSNDLDSIYTTDYFCGYFHDWAQVAEVWRLKRDVKLSAAHVSRALLPNLLAQNAVRRPVGPVVEMGPSARPVNGWLTPSAGEPVLEAVDWLVADPAPVEAPPAGPPGEVLLTPSRVSRHYLGRMRALCAERGVRLRALPGPTPGGVRFADTAGIYDAGIWYVEAGKFVDNIHLRAEHLEEVRGEWMRQMGVDLSNGQARNRSPNSQIPMTNQ